MAHTLQERYAQLVDAKLRASLVTKEGIVCNTKYEGNPKAGKVKVPVRDGETTVSDYDKAKGITLSNGSTTYIDISLDKDKAVNELIDGYDAVAVPDNLVADRLDSAGYSLAAALDQDCIDTLQSEGTIYATKTALTSGTVYKTFVDLGVTLDNAFVPQENRFALVSPDVYALLLQDTTNFIRQSALSQEMIMSGVVGQIAGFNIIKTPRMMKGNTTLVTGKTTTTEIIAGHPDWVTRVPEWQVEPHVQDLSGSGKYIGACAVQGRKIFAHKVTKAAAVIVKRSEV